jgi:NADH-quinone oxidoreductase subunit G
LPESQPPKKIAKITVDGRVVETSEGANLLQLLLDLEMDIPHYCYHPKLSIDGSCRLCQVKIEGMPKLQIACNTQVRDGMVIHVADKDVDFVRKGALELLLINHPLDCPICDKAGECWLQNYSYRFSNRESRTLEPRRKHEKRMDIGNHILLDQERCILCRRCVRFCREISETGELIITGQAEHSVLDIYDQRLDNDYSMCVTDICPVGALESKDFHHKLRVWFLEEQASVCPGCSNGCNIMVCHHVNRVWRLLPRRNDEVNDTWMCDEGRFTYKALHAPDRIFLPKAARDGISAPMAWSDAMQAASDGLAKIIDRQGGAAVGAIVSPHLTVEENFQFKKLLDAIGAKHIAMAVRRGRADDFLIKSEKAANANGVRKLNMVSGADDGLEALLATAESGELKALYICGDDIAEVADQSRLKRALEKVEFVIVQAMRVPAALDRAAVVIPSTGFAEKTGTFVNHAGRAQRILQALQPPQMWLNDAQVFIDIRNRIQHTHETWSLEQTWRDIAASYPGFASIAEIGPAGVAIAQLESAAA